MIELEKTYLARYLPKDLEKFFSKEIIDIYIPVNARHCRLRIRKTGNEFEMTKKMPVKWGDNSTQKERTIILTAQEFEELDQIKGKRVRKLRYYFPYKNKTAEIDVFQDKLRGLVTVDFEFEKEEEKEKFEMPEFCLADVTQENFIAGGMLAGKSYEDVVENLKKFGYKKL